MMTYDVYFDDACVVDHYTSMKFYPRLKRSLSNREMRLGMMLAKCNPFHSGADEIISSSQKLSPRRIPSRSPQGSRRSSRKQQVTSNGSERRVLSAALHPDFPPDAIAVLQATKDEEDSTGNCWWSASVGFTGSANVVSRNVHISVLNDALREMGRCIGGFVRLICHHSSPALLRWS